jgi:hypothetical protein
VCAVQYYREILSSLAIVELERKRVSEEKEGALRYNLRTATGCLTFFYCTFAGPQRRYTVMLLLLSDYSLLVVSRRKKISSHNLRQSRYVDTGEKTAFEKGCSYELASESIG